MNCWDVLGLTPTRSKAEIRHAFAEKSKTCHPEDNPEGFAALRAAYTEALRAAETIGGGVHILVDAPEPQRQGVVIEVPGGVLGSAANGGSEAAQRYAMPGKTAISFEGLDNQIKKQDAEQRRITTDIFGEMHVLCLNRNARESAKKWNEFFEGENFSKVCKNSAFTWQALDLFMRQAGFPGSVAEKVIVPRLREWQYLWNGTQMWNRFEVALGQMEKDKAAKKGGRENKGGRAAIAVISVLVLLLAITGAVKLLLLQTSGTETTVQSAQVQTPAFNPKMPFAFY